MTADWFCKIGEKKVGPLNAQQLKTFVATGQLRPEHLVRRGSEGPWVPAGRIKGLFVSAESGGSPQHEKPPLAGKPLPKAVTSNSAPAAHAIPLPAAAVPVPPPADIPQDLSLGGHHKHHVQMDVDKFHIETTPLMVSQRKTKSGLQSMKKSEQKKATIILLSVIVGGTAIGLVVFIWAAVNGMLFGPESPKKVEETPVAEKAPAPANTAVAKAEIEKKPVPKPAEPTWPTNFKPVSFENTLVGNVEVMALKPIRGAPPEALKINGEEVLIVPVNLQLKDVAKKNVEFTGWDDASLKKNVMLSDDKDGKGNHFEFLGQVFKKGDDAKTLAQRRIQVQLVFELPGKFPKTMYLALPAAALHVDGPMIAYKFDSNEIGRGTPKSP